LASRLNGCEFLMATVNKHQPDKDDNPGETGVWKKDLLHPESLPLPRDMGVA